jgi:hypothetical protein
MQNKFHTNIDVGFRLGWSSKLRRKGKQGTRYKVQGTRKVKGARDKEGSEGLRMEDSRQFAIINEKSNVGAIQERL